MHFTVGCVMLQMFGVALTRNVILQACRGLNSDYAEAVRRGRGGARWLCSLILLERWPSSGHERHDLPTAIASMHEIAEGDAFDF